MTDEPINFGAARERQTASSFTNGRAGVKDRLLAQRRMFADRITGIDKALSILHENPGMEFAIEEMMKIDQGYF